MQTRRDYQLQQLGIRQWVLRRPATLNGIVKIKLPDQISLLLVADSPPPMNHPLVIDVARSMGLTSIQLYGVNLEQVMMLPEEDLRCHCWWLGLEATRNFAGLSFHTPPLLDLSQNANAKRELWRRISDNEYLITNVIG